MKYLVTYKATYEDGVRERSVITESCMHQSKGVNEFMNDVRGDSTGEVHDIAILYIHELDRHY